MAATQPSERFLVQAGIGVSVLLVLATALSSAWVMAVASGVLLLGLLAYTGFGFRRSVSPRKGTYWVMTVVAIVAAATATGIVLATR